MWAVRPFMVWNGLLALVPFALAVLIFRPNARRNVVWWAGLAVWIAFLPNAPYVLTDVVHLVDDMQRTSADRDAYALLVVYGAFFALGLALYGISMWLCERRLDPWIGVTRRRVVAVAIHLACAVGVYLGRFVRVNSWDVVTDPQRVGGGVRDLGDRFPIVVVLLTFVGLVIASFAVRVVAHAGADMVTRAVRSAR